MTVKAQILAIVDLIPDAELPTILEVVKHFVPATAEDMATAEDIEAHNAAMKEYATGETVPHDAINWN